MERAGLYRSRVCALRSLEAVRVCAASIAGIGAFIGCQALAGHVTVTGPVVAGAAAAAAVLVLRWRFTLWLKGRRSVPKFLRTVVLVGTDEDAEGLWNLLSEEPELGYRVGAVAGEARPGTPWEGLAQCGDLERLGELAQRSGANGVIVVASALSAKERSKAVNLAQAAGLHVQISAGPVRVLGPAHPHGPRLGHPPALCRAQAAPKWELAIKRAMDVTIAIFLGLLRLPSPPPPRWPSRWLRAATSFTAANVSAATA